MTVVSKPFACFFRHFKAVMLYRKAPSSYIDLMRLFLLLQTLCICSFLSAQSTLEWLEAYSGPGDQFEHAREVMVDGNDNSYLLGVGYDSTSGNNWNHIVKFNANGVQQWSYSDSSNLGFTASLVDPDGHVYLVTTPSNLQTFNNLIKLDTNGQELWRVNNLINTYSTVPIDMQFSPQGDVVVAFQSQGSNGGMKPLEIRKVSSSGNLLASFTRQTTGESLYMDLDYDAAGNIYVVGITDFAFGSSAGNEGDLWLLKFDASLNLQWEHQFNTTSNAYEAGFEIIVGPNGNIYTQGIQCSGLNCDLVVKKFNNSGTFQWGTTVRANASPSAIEHSFFLSPNGVLVSVMEEGAYDHYAVATLNTSGVPQTFWTSSIDPSLSDREGQEASMDAYGNLTICGNIPGQTNNPVWFHSFDDNGTEIRNGVLTPIVSGNQGAVDFVQSPSGHFYFGARYFDPLANNDPVMYMAKVAHPLVGQEEALEESPVQAVVFPSPMTSVSTMVFSEALPAGSSMAIYDVWGRKIREQKAAGEQIEIERRGLSAGLYLCHLSNAGKDLGTVRLLVQ